MRFSDTVTIQTSEWQLRWGRGKIIVSEKVQQLTGGATGRMVLMTVLHDL